MSYVIIGGGIAGISAAKAIRQRDASGPVTVIAEEGAPYYRPLIPKLISGEKTTAELGWAEDINALGLQLITGRASSVDTASRQVKLADGRSIQYSKLLIASGAKARRLNIPGSDAEGVFTLRTAADAGKIKAMLPSAKKAAVIGGGFVGVKAAEALNKAGVDVTVIEALPSILQPRLDKQGAEIIASALTAKGIKILTSETISEFVVDKKFKGVKLASGKTVHADFAVVAVGTEPNIEYLKGSAVRLDKGVAVTETLESSMPGIYAAGDAVRYRDVLTGQAATSALWSNAAEMGRIAGLNMAGDSLKYPGFLAVRNATEVAGVPVVSIGQVGVDVGLEVISRHGGERLYRMLAFRGDTLAGAVFMGELRGAGLYASLIREARPLKAAQKEMALADRLTYAHFVN